MFLIPFRGRYLHFVGSLLCLVSLAALVFSLLQLDKSSVLVGFKAFQFPFEFQFGTISLAVISGFFTGFYAVWTWFVSAPGRKEDWLLANLLPASTLAAGLILCLELASTGADTTVIAKMAFLSLLATLVLAVFAHQTLVSWRKSQSHLSE